MIFLLLHNDQKVSCVIYHYSTEYFCTVPEICTPQEVEALAPQYFPNYGFVEYICEESRRECLLALMKSDMCYEYNCRYGMKCQN